MNKSFILLTCLLTFALTDEIRRSPILIGGYTALAENDIQDVEEFPSIEEFARSEFAKQNSGEFLGDLISVDRQLVAGFNYKMVFATQDDDVEIIVFDQSWTNTREVTSITKLPAKREIRQ
jgi:hypothetical protein